LRCPTRYVTLLPRSFPNTMSSESSRSVSAIALIRKRLRDGGRYTGATMSDDRNFLARWSRRKRNTAPETREQLKPENDGSDVTSEASAPSLLSSETKAPFDPASLPPIESIGAGSDIRAFLAAGVPADYRARHCAAFGCWIPRSATSSVFPRIRRTSTHQAQWRVLNRLTRRRPDAF
jgi:hypothetical protein